MIVATIPMLIFFVAPTFLSWVSYNNAKSESQYPIDLLISAKDARINVIITSHITKDENVSNVVLSGDKLNYRFDNSSFTIKHGLSVRNYTLPFDLPDGSYTLLFNTTRLFVGYGSKLNFPIALIGPQISEQPPENYVKYVIPIQYTQTFSINTKPSDTSGTSTAVLLMAVVFMVVIGLSASSRRNGK